VATSRPLNEWFQPELGEGVWNFPGCSHFGWFSRCNDYSRRNFWGLFGLWNMSLLCPIKLGLPWVGQRKWYKISWFGELEDITNVTKVGVEIECVHSSERVDWQFDMQLLLCNVHYSAVKREKSLMKCVNAIDSRKL